MHDDLLKKNVRSKMIPINCRAQVSAKSKGLIVVWVSKAFRNQKSSRSLPDSLLSYQPSRNHVE